MREINVVREIVPAAAILALSMSLVHCGAKDDDALPDAGAAGAANPSQEATGRQAQALSAGDFSLVCRGNLLTGVPDQVSNYCDIDLHPGGCTPAQQSVMVAFIAGQAPVNFDVPQNIIDGGAGGWEAGECRWWDRAFRPGEPLRLAFGSLFPDQLEAVFGGGNEVDRYASFAVHSGFVHTTSGTVAAMIVDAALCANGPSTGTVEPPDESGCTDFEAHQMDVTGPLLDSSGSPCVAEVCSYDPFCCTVQWDSICIGEAATPDCRSGR
jgi:hypothetical protein